MENEQKKPRRLVFVLCPLQGHINPMLQLATILHSKGFSITIFHPQFNSPNPSNHPDFTFIPIPDKQTDFKSYVLPGGFATLISAVNSNCLASLKQCINQILNEKDSDGRLAGIIYDMLMYSAQSVADDLGIPGISVRTSAVATMLVYGVFHRPDGKGYTSCQDILTSENQTLAPELQSLQLQEITSSVSLNPTDDMTQLRAAVTNASQITSAIIANTMDFLEQTAMLKIKEHFPAPIFPIGPFHQLAPTGSNSLLKEDTDCLSWLDKQAPTSVLYVSFGSMASIDQQELTETAWGLANSEQPFLWVVRPDLVRGDGLEWNEILPQDFLERVGGRGCIVKWAPQTKVLAHGAVGGFWSHCGWNSTLESISEGVPMLCRPFFGDQVFNSRYICRVWKVGLEVETDKLERGKIEESVKRLMVGLEAEEMRKNAMDLKEKTELCLKEGGSSYNFLNDFVKHVSSD